MKIARRILDRIIEHAKKDAPIEACGYLACRESIITASYPLRNMDKSGEHFSFYPEEQFAAVRDARSKNLQICAVYHSHPNTPARPSDEDKRLAYDPDILYAIVSLAGGRQEMKIFKIIGYAVEEVELEVTEP